MRKSLIASELDKLPFCNYDWIKLKCHFDVDNGHKPTLQDCFDCVFAKFAHDLDREALAQAQHRLEILRKMVKEPSP